MPIIKSQPLPKIKKRPSYGEQRRGLLRFGTKVGKRDIRLGAKTINVFPGQDIQTAIDTLDKDDGGIVFLKVGTHTLTKNISGKSKVSIIGEGRDATIIECGGNAYGLNYTGVSGTEFLNFKLEDFTLQNSNNTAGISIDYCDFWSMENVRVTSCDQGGILIQHCENFFIQNVRSDNNTTDGFKFVGDATAKNQNFSLINCQGDNNTEIGFNFSATGANLVDFTCLNCNAESNTGDGYDFSGGSVALDGSMIGCNAEGNGGIGFDIDVVDISFIGCQSDSNTGDGFEVSQAANRLIGCSTNGNGTEFDINASTVIIGSRFPTGTTTIPSDEYSETDTLLTISLGNRGGNTRTEKIVYQMKNVSGSAVAAGDVGVFNAGADGDEITSTTSQGDDLVFGMWLNSPNNNEYGQFLVQGYTKKLKVDGTIDIAIGDFLGTSTIAGIAMKAASGDMAFAIALEAYTTDDSSGVIDALIIKPRKIINLATIAETDTGTDATKAITPDGLAGSEFGERAIQIVVFDFTTDVATGNGKFYFHIDSRLAGMNLVDVHAEVITAGTTNTTDIQLRNVTQAADILSTKLTIDSGETGSDTAATAAVIDTAEDDMTENDVIAIDVDAISTTAPKGLIITLGFRLP